MTSLKNFSMITNDSREVKQGAIFVAMPGGIHDGCDYIVQAVDAGAEMVVVPKGKVERIAGVEWRESDDIRLDYALLCAEFYERQPEHIVAVTGTNGKSSVADFARQLWGGDAVSLGTIGVIGAGFNRSARLTTLDPSQLYNILAECSEAGVKHLAMEASSHGLDQDRLSGVKIQCAAFTNLSHDHLDYHPTMEDYFQAKLKLFGLLEAGAVAVINADIEQAEQLVVYAKERKLRIISYGRSGDTLKIVSAKPVASGIEAEIFLAGETHKINVPLLGEFQLYNALAALGLCYPDTLQDNLYRLEKLKPVKGRMDLVEGHPYGANVFVDYAHTPDALKTVLTALRPHLSNDGRLISVIGCGGDRDTAKRAPMARIAGELSQEVIITDDNPRSENPADIRANMLQGWPEALEVDGRANAIKKAVMLAQKGDILLVAGKGHEQGQTIGDTVYPFDDYEEILKAYKEEA